MSNTIYLYVPWPYIRADFGHVSHNQRWFIQHPIQFHSKLKGEWLGEPQEVVTRKVEKKARSSLISFCESATRSQSEMLTAACVYEAEKFALPRRNVSSILDVLSKRHSYLKSPQVCSDVLALGRDLNVVVLPFFFCQKFVPTVLQIKLSL